jgi:hypothetical protein
MTLKLNAAPAVALNRKRRPERRGEKRYGPPKANDTLSSVAGKGGNLLSFGS